MNLKRMTASIVLVALAVTTGVFVGLKFIDDNTVIPFEIDYTEEDLREEDSVVESLVQQAKSGAAVTSFNAIELYQIAENNLFTSDFLLKEMTGKTSSFFVDLSIRSQKIKQNGKIVYYKLCPSTSSLTPNIATRTVYDSANPDSISVVTANKSCFTNTSSAATLDAVLTDSTLETNITYTSEEYLAAYNTMPDSSLLSYIISTNTCTLDNCSAVTDNGDGTYSFTISFSGSEQCAYPALYYSNEIKSSSGYTNPTLVWSKITFTATIDSSFRFTSISYEETYTISAVDLVIGSASVTDYFDEVFFYDESALENRVISDYAEVA